MNTFTSLFLAALAVSSGIEYWLARRQANHVRLHRDRVPDAFRDSVSLEEHRKAADYTLAKGNLDDVGRIVGIAILLGFTLGGGIDAIAAFWNGFGLAPIATGVGVVLTTLLASQLLELPLRVYQTFWVEERFGFNRTTPRQFMIDLGLQTALSVVIGGPLLALILWVMDSAGTHWWIIAWAILMAFSILMSWAFPTFIAPLFNKFTPLADVTLKTRIEALLERCGFHSKGIFVMDGSKRSGHGNAYFTGIGNNKRIVFFDTLVDSLNHDEIEAVLAHELGHFKRRHVLKMLAGTSLVTLAGFGLLGWLSGEAWFYQGLGVSEQSNAIALLLFMLVSPVFSVFLQPLMAYVQRRYEFEADDFAASHTRTRYLINALVKLYRENASTLTPDPLYAAFHYSHPPAAIRIDHLTAKI
ncbi:M48 family metallopeptidase [Methylococcus geothermalis]|uniref:M48 family metalloprotease n=1 Tax=Methylococcus geothermalis TaxID=2681310 RepID=A0A858QAS7_9GAMM|nr:M48 family metallopeptidase [Methylococcus geothermalis]QJD30881.1 M48 family metalloprotease [Methylococcus geothermalis]